MIYKFLDKLFLGIWYSNNFIFKIISFLLLPLSIVYLIAFNLRTYFRKTHYFGISIICIGNIVVGGSGKTSIALAIIVPRHPNRRKLSDQMPHSKVVIRSANGQVDKSTDIYLADTFGELGLFYKLADFIFIGGSFVPHGGQNPIEAAYFCNNIFHGRYVENFTEVYETLGHLSITEPVDNSRQLQVKLMKCYDAPPSDEDELMRKINLEATDVLKDTMHHLNSNILNNDI